MASLGNSGFLSQGEGKRTGPALELLQSSVEGENSDFETQPPNQVSTLEHDKITPQPSVSESYNVAGGYATGPYSNPYGSDDITFKGRRLEELNSTPKVVAKQPGREVGFAMTDEEIEAIKSVSVSNVIVMSMASTITCCCFGIAAVLASFRFRSAMNRRDIESAVIELEKADTYTKRALQVGFIFIMIFIFVVIIIANC